MGNDADDILHSFTHFSAEDKRKYATVKARFDNHFMKRQNIIFEHTKFNGWRFFKGNDVATQYVTLSHHTGVQSTIE